MPLHRWVPICYSSPMTMDEELNHLRQENQALQTTNQILREGLLEAIHAIEALQQRVKDLEGVVAFQQERLKDA
jgi:transposase